MADGPGVGTPRSDDLFARAERVIPGGVNSPVRSFRSVGGHPYFVARGEGAYVWDADGSRLLDFVQSYGASILGHADPEVVAAVRAAAGRGTTFGAPTEGEVLLAEAITAPRPRVRAGPAGVLGDRGRHERHPGGPRLHRAGTASSSSPAATTATRTGCWPGAAAGWPPSGSRTRPGYRPVRWPTPS